MGNKDFNESLIELNSNGKHSFLALTGIAFSAFIILFIAGGYLYTQYDNYVVNKRPKTAEEIRAEKIKNSFNSWDGSHYELTRLIKKNMHDPESYQHVSTRFHDDRDSLLIRTSYRGKNAFGAVVLNRLVARVDLDGNLVQIISQE